MIIQDLYLKNFRNYRESSFVFSSGTNLIVGPNASGKTNILEAICLLATGKSFRVKGVESEMIEYKEEIGRIKGGVEGSKAQEGEVELEIILTRGEIAGEKVGKKKYLVNGVAKRAVDFLGNLRAVYFGPEDLELVTDSPSLRRKYLDMVLYQVDREYTRASLSYEKGLRSRNRLLEEMKETGSEDRRKLFFWDQLLIKNGNIITEKREEFINFLNLRKGFEGVEGFEVEYDRSTISRERLKQYEKEEVAVASTLVGPHRDNFKFRVEEWESERAGGGHDLSVYGSRGEQRLAILWLKLGELTFIKEETSGLPVLLLDDIFSELDLGHRELVFDLIGDSQTIITTSDMGMVGGMVEKKWLEGVKIIELG